MAADEVLEAHDGPEDGDPDAEDDDAPVLYFDPSWTIWKAKQWAEAENLTEDSQIEWRNSAKE